MREGLHVEERLAGGWRHAGWACKRFDSKGQKSRRPIGGVLHPPACLPRRCQSGWCTRCTWDVLACPGTCASAFIPASRSGCQLVAAPRQAVPPGVRAANQRAAPPRPRRTHPPGLLSSIGLSAPAAPSDTEPGANAWQRSVAHRSVAASRCCSRCLVDAAQRPAACLYAGNVAARTPTCCSRGERARAKEGHTRARV